MILIRQDDLNFVAGATAFPREPFPPIGFPVPDPIPGHLPYPGTAPLPKPWPHPIPTPNTDVVAP